MQEPEYRPNTLAKYKTFTNQLQAYADGRGYLYVDQLTVNAMDLFYASWEDGLRAKAKELEPSKHLSVSVSSANGLPKILPMTCRLLKVLQSLFRSHPSPMQKFKSSTQLVMRLVPC
jgi:hypothetical protein